MSLRCFAWRLCCLLALFGLPLTGSAVQDMSAGSWQSGCNTLLVPLGIFPVSSGAWVVSHVSCSFLLVSMRSAPSWAVFGFAALAWSLDRTLHASEDCPA